MRPAYWSKSFKVILLLYASSFSVLGQATEPKLLTVMEENAFNQLWNKECRDTGERPLEPYLVPPASFAPYPWESKSNALLTNFLSYGQVVIVSDNFYNTGIKCYRRYNLTRIIVKKGKNYPVLISSNFFSVYNHNIHSIYADFLSSSLDKELYVTRYWSRVNRPKEERELYYTFFKRGSDLLGFEYYSNNITIFHLIKDKEDTYIRKNIQVTSSADISFFPENTRYKFTQKGLLTKLPAEKKFYFSAGSAPSEFSPVMGLKRQIKFIPSVHSQQENISKIVELLSTKWNYFLDLPANDDKDWISRKKWLLGWINGKGYLTKENGKKVFLPNRERLNIWLIRYLKKRHVILKKGKTYYFSRDLSHYMIMDFYKENGQPIFSQHPENPCKRYMHLDPRICNF